MGNQVQSRMEEHKVFDVAEVVGSWGCSSRSMRSMARCELYLMPDGRAMAYEMSQINWDDDGPSRGAVSIGTWAYLPAEAESWSPDAGEEVVGYIKMNVSQTGEREQKSWGFLGKVSEWIESSSERTYEVHCGSAILSLR